MASAQSWCVGGGGGGGGGDVLGVRMAVLVVLSSLCRNTHVCMYVVCTYMCVCVCVCVLLA